MKQRDLAIILIPVLILTIFWVVSNVYNNFVTSTIKVPVIDEIIPIAGSFDTKTIEQIKTRTRVNSLDEVSAQVSETPTPSPTLTPSLSPNPTPGQNGKSGTESAQTKP